ncbi:MAG: hypothetical protein AAGJ37_14500 [Pseudomonadota bacterium]
MSLLITACEYSGAEKKLNTYLQSVSTAKHALTLFNATLLDALLMNNKPENTVEDLQGLHADIKVNTHSQFTIHASPEQMSQQRHLNSLLDTKKYSDFTLLNSLYQAPLAAKNDSESVPIEVINNLSWLSRKQLQHNECHEEHDELDEASATLAETFIDALEKSQALSTAIV